MIGREPNQSYWAAKHVDLAAELAVNNPYARGFERLSDNYVVGPVDAWEGTGPEGGSLVVHGGYVYMFYAAFTSAMNLQIGWMRWPRAQFPLGTPERCGDNPIFAPGKQEGVDDLIVATPRVQQLANLSWRMDYHSLASGLSDLGCVAFCSAANFPGGPGDWVPYAGNPIIPLGTAGEFDDLSIHNEITVYPDKTPDGLGHCFYGGAKTGITGEYWRCGHKTSTDMLSWTNRGMCMVPHPGSTWRPLGIHPTSGIVQRGSGYYMLTQGFTGSTWHIGAFGSLDYFTWVEMPGNPVLSPRPGKWDAGAVEDPYLLEEDDGRVTILHISADTYLSTNYRLGAARTL